MVTQQLTRAVYVDLANVGFSHWLMWELADSLNLNFTYNSLALDPAVLEFSISTFFEIV